MNMRCERDDVICIAKYRAPDSIFLRFDDGVEATIATKSLGLSPAIRWDTLQTSPNGESITVLIPTGERVPIDASNLRYHADPAYAARREIAFDDLLCEDDVPPAVFFDHPAQTPRF